MNYSVHEKYSSTDICSVPLLENQTSQNSESAAQAGVLYEIHSVYRKVIAALAKFLFVPVAFYHIHISNEINDLRSARF